VVVDSREVGPGDLFIGLPGARVDGGSFAAQALDAGAWGVLVSPTWGMRTAAEQPAGGAVLVAEDPVFALGALARGWRRELGVAVIGVTGSVGKTSTKDLIAALIAPHRKVAASRANFNTEIGLPLEVLATEPGTEVLVLEMGMRGFGQISQLASIAEPDVAVITNIGPVHLEQMGSLEGVARAKAELVVGLRPAGVAVVPFGEQLLDSFLVGRHVVTFGPGGDVAWAPDGTIATPDGPVSIELGELAAHHRLNALAAVAAAQAVGVTPAGRVDVRFGALRGERVALPLGALVINDCYNANPLSMRAALADLASAPGSGRRVAVLGDMLELGPEEERHHHEIGAAAAAAGVELLVAVGPRSRAMAEGFGGEVVLADDAAAAAQAAARVVRAGDVVLVKASRGVGLEVVAERLLELPAPRSRVPVPDG
jgi:UDP-N-acetylmuramoyl-tripeptide--D-alanyl-D-alanine ligase